MSTEISLDLVQTMLPKSHQGQVDDTMLEEIKKLAENPDYGPDFLQAYWDCLNVLAENPKNSHTQYLNALKFFSLIEAGHSLTDAYIKTFPDRYEARAKGNPNADKSIIRGEASRFNQSKLVNQIRQACTMPVQLIHRHLLHEAILENAKLMKTAKSEMVRQKAADTLIRELKPAEENIINVKVEDNSTSVIQDLRAATMELAQQQQKAIEGGMPTKQIAAARIFSREDDVIEAELVDE